MEPKKIICYKPGPQWPKPLPSVSEGIHPSPRSFIRRVIDDWILGDYDYDAYENDACDDPR